MPNCTSRAWPRAAAGGHGIPHDKIRARFDSARENLLELLPHLDELQVYDNSTPADADGAEPMPVLQMNQGQLRYPVSVAELLHTPDWAKPIVMRAMELQGS
ncbi:MAG: hypothetical protein GAK31_00195 [Stenotrophomonas maltophilia]|uniref:Uncharacterized protein n=1 Tax=Stenotrophomonas maltophilia TaxID=40324 RepID=A0A7V8FJ13_STEMA|nr:MAG: hypothetical protein GAK31_00195 [Stenotrophomonas maltophilia]